MMPRRTYVVVVLYALCVAIILKLVLDSSEQDQRESKEQTRDINTNASSSSSSSKQPRVDHTDAGPQKENPSPPLSTYSYSFTENSTTKTGVPFTIDKELLKTFGYRELPLQHFEEDLNEENWRDLDFVFVTASSEGHFPESTDAVASIQKFFPDKTILYYDWGLSQRQIDKLHTWCNVKYRYFNLSGFFPATKGMQMERPFLYYAGKALTVAHAFQDYPAILWLDTSVRFLHGNLTPVFQKARENGGMVFFNRLFHSTYCVTHPSLYSYLPSSTDRLKTTNQLEAIYFIYKSKEIYENIVWWLHLCAMEPQCIAPVYKLECHFPDKNYTKYVGCHRYDQSTINVLSASYFGFDERKYWVCLGRQGYYTLIVKRTVTHMYEVQTCNAH